MSPELSVSQPEPSGLRPLDTRFARFLGELAGERGPALSAAACLVSQQLGEGHICVDLRDYAGRTLFADRDGAHPGIDAPALGQWRAALERCSVVQGPDDDAAPLVLDGTRLYLRRYWCFERRLAERLVALGHRHPEIDDALLGDGLARLFGPVGDTVDWQRVAAAVAVLRPFAVISGGPGTGKTRTVSRVLALLIEQGLAAGKVPRIRLAAPTGKAAARLTESIATSVPAPEAVSSEDVLDALPRQATTLHRLLRARPDRVQVGHNAVNPLHLDVLLIDEASMVDLPLMARVVDALPHHARLILLGDRDQLSSVEAGAVLGDLCAGAEGFTEPMIDRLNAITGDDLPPGRVDSVLSDSVGFLYRSWRFREHDGDRPGIGALARSIREGLGDETVTLLLEARDDGAPDPAAALSFTSMGEGALPAALGAEVLAHYRWVAAASTPTQALERLDRLRVLCALREGPFGVRTVNRFIRDALGVTGEHWYHGQPVMITSNDYGLGLHNGDIGVVWHGESGSRVHFPDAEHGTHHFAPQRLPAHETVYAMTVHKSQGSEFDTVVLLLPDKASPVLTRELLYTGITRARARVRVWGSTDVIRETVTARPTRRRSGLQQQMRTVRHPD